MRVLVTACARSLQSKEAPRARLTTPGMAARAGCLPVRSAQRPPGARMVEGRLTASRPTHKRRPSTTVLHVAAPAAARLLVAGMHAVPRLKRLGNPAVTAQAVRSVDPRTTGVAGGALRIAVEGCMHLTQRPGRKKLRLSGAPSEPRQAAEHPEGRRPTQGRRPSNS